MQIDTSFSCTHHTKKLFDLVVEEKKNGVSVRLIDYESANKVGMPFLGKEGGVIAEIYIRKNSVEVEDSSKHFNFYLIFMRDRAREREILQRACSQVCARFMRIFPVRT